MEEIKENDRNDVILQGYVVFCKELLNSTVLMIKTGYHYEDATKTNAPRVLLNGERLEQMKAQGIRVGSYVKIKANVQSTRKTLEDGTHQYSQIPFVEEIELIDRLPGDFGRPGRYPDPINECILDGEITNIHQLAENVLRITVRTIKNGHLSYVQCYRTKPGTEKVLEKLSVGDRVHMECFIKSKKKNRNGQLIPYHDVTVKVIQKL